ncbi:MAG TPA: histidine phosphotransferase family protein [Rhizomicrobium sp.]|jgi:histidine phosphotransferase ChpT|nr:histidine phosphotransferase family protein [Rhizomicrobium sp.]
MSSSMNEIDFAALLVSRVCHDLVGPLGAVVNGMEVLEDERDPTMRADAIRLVTSSADQALARIQFMRIAFGAAGSAGAELDLGEVGRLVQGLLDGGKVSLEWNVPRVYWAKDWAKLLMNATLLAADCLPRGGIVTVQAGADPAAPSFRIRAAGQSARLTEEVDRSLRGEAVSVDARHVQPFLTHKLSRAVNAALTVSPLEGAVELAAG